jgi:hypothetical protein
MEQVNSVITTTFGLLLMASVAYEIRRLRKKLRALYNLLDNEDKAIVAELDEMLSTGQLQRFTPS